MIMENKKPRIALLGMGVLGGGPLGQGVPVLEETITRITARFDIVFYSFIRTKSIREIQTKQPVSFYLPGRLKYSLMMAKVIWDNLFNPFDIILSVSAYPTGLVAIRLGKILKKPAIISLISLEAVSLPDIASGNFSKPWLARITRHVCQMADGVTTLTNYQREIAFEFLSRKIRIDVLPLRIDAEKFPFHPRKISGSVRLLHVGYFHPLKDQVTLFKVFAKVLEQIDCSLTVVGTGFNNPKVQNILDSLSISNKVIFAGEKKQSDLHTYYNSAHILIHTSRYEAECAVVQEAMASGLPVVGTRVGLLADIGKKYGETAEPTDVGGLASKLLHLVNNAERYEELQKNAYEFISQNDVKRSSLHYADYLISMLQQKN